MQLLLLLLLMLLMLVLWCSQWQGQLIGTSIGTTSKIMWLRLYGQGITLLRLLFLLLLGHRCGLLGRLLLPGNCTLTLSCRRQRLGLMSLYILQINIVLNLKSVCFFEGVVNKLWTIYVGVRNKKINGQCQRQMAAVKSGAHLKQQPHLKKIQQIHVRWLRGAGGAGCENRVASTSLYNTCVCGSGSN